MAPKNLVLLAALLLAATAADGQLGGLPTAADPVVCVMGAIGCPLTSAVGSFINAALVPPFANVTVQLVCGSTVVASATTNSNGAFMISTGGVSSTTPGVLISLLSGQCKVVVPTNVSLGGITGTLSAPVLPLANVTAVVGDTLAVIQPFGGLRSMVISGTLMPLITGLFSLLLL